MRELFEANWPASGLALALAVLLVLLAGWWLLLRSRRSTRTRHRAPDALDEGAAPAARNQALIDAPSAVAVNTVGEAAVLERAPVPVAKPAPPPLVSPPPAPVAAPPAPVAAPKPAAKPKPLKAKPAPAPKAEPKPKPARKPKAVPKPKAVAVPKPVPTPAPEPVAPPPEPAPAAPAAAPDELARIKGLGPKLQSLLPTLGITTLAQIAAWDDADIDRIDAQLGVFAGRIRKDSWVEQAKFLAAGDTAGFEGKFGKV